MNLETNATNEKSGTSVVNQKTTANTDDLKLQDHKVGDTKDEVKHDVLTDINPAELRLPDESLENLFVPKDVTLPIKFTPNRSDYFMTPPADKNLSGRFSVLTGTGVDSDCYLVHPKIHDDLLPDVKATTITLAMNQWGGQFLWCVNDQVFENDSWGATRREAFIRSRTEPISMRSNRNMGRYDIIVAKNSKLLVPEWPSGVTIDDLIKVAFKDKLICSFDHPAIKRLRGEIL